MLWTHATWTGGVYLCGPLRPLQFCDMIPRLLCKIGGVCPCTGSPKEKGHVAGRRCGRWARGGVDGDSPTFLAMIPKRLLTEWDGVTCCHRPWQGSPDAQTNRKFQPRIPGTTKQQMARPGGAGQETSFEVRGRGCKTLERGPAGGVAAAGAAGLLLLRARRPWQPPLPCSHHQNNSSKAHNGDLARTAIRGQE